MKHRTASLALALGSILLLAGCGGKSKPESPTPQSIPAGSGAGGPSAPAEASSGATSGDAAAAEAASRRAAAVRARAVLEQKVFFDFDRSDLSDQARATLNAKLELLRSYPAVALTIAGHADERGSDEYNLALGNRRAGAVKQFLTQHGVLSGRMQAVSFGEEQPAVNGHDESTWSQNRRAEFSITAGLD